MAAVVYTTASRDPSGCSPCSCQHSAGFLCSQPWSVQEGGPALAPAPSPSGWGESLLVSIWACVREAASAFCQKKCLNTGRQADMWATKRLNIRTDIDISSQVAVSRAQPWETHVGSPCRALPRMWPPHGHGRPGKVSSSSAPWCVPPREAPSFRPTKESRAGTSRRTRRCPESHQGRWIPRCL